MNKKFLLCIGAGKSQYPLIKAAKKLGCKVLGIDRNKNAHAVPLLDKFLHISTYQTQKVLHSLTALSAELIFSGIIARSSGPALLTTAAIAEKWNLCGLTVDFAKLATHKSNLREFCIKHRLPVPSGVRLLSLKKQSNSFNLPVIIKPDLSLIGKKNVRLVKEKDTLAFAFAQAKDVSGNSRVEVQQFIDGYDVACLFHIKHGTAKIITYWDELVGLRNDLSCKGIGVNIPSIIASTKIQNDTDQLVKKFSALFPTVEALAILSMRITSAGKPFIIELHTDLGGDLIADKLFPKADKNFDYFSLAVKIALKLETENIYPKFKPCCMLYGKNSKETFITQKSTALTIKKSFEKINRQNLYMPPKHNQFKIGNLVEE